MNMFEGIGRLTADPEVRYTQGENSMAIARFTIAIDRGKAKDGSQNTDFIRCVALNKQGEFAERYLCKGLKVGIVGGVRTGSYTDRDGKRINTTEIAVQEFTFCEKRDQMRENAINEAVDDGFVTVPVGVEEELPFN